MAAGNGVDLGQIVSMLVNLTTQVGTLQAEVGALRAEVGTLRAEIGTLRADVGTLRADLDSFRRETKAELAGLRQTIELYHGSVVGHGIAITELNERLERVEDHLGFRQTPQ